ncbi:hypothetical protein IEQ34_020243 [Dendrobium chrysotoxum]|uniref:Uncharacterized protein n=1 Tax=Dendrobium chrysotoxum TaxID=161865 RepID=A0AAV7FZM5_DENCH|nr:hypothetical protein IEQ34_020243 [Dendrobium chrysotoxum]
MGEVRHNPSSATMALKPVSVNEEAKKVLEEELPKKPRHPHTIRYIEKKLVDKGFHRMERHPGDGISLARGPPKSGHGGPFTWEGPDSEFEPEPDPVAFDEADPDYVEEEEVKEMVVGEVEVAKVAEAKEGVSRIEIRTPDQV